MRTNAPVDRTALVGRDGALATLAEHFDEGARLVTLVGSAGTGKSRLVRAYVAQSLDEGLYEGGIWFCKLTRAGSQDELLAALAEVLDVIPDIEAISDVLSDRGRCLVVLDGFDRLVQWAPDTIGQWLDDALEARFLVTSREVLGLSGESRQELRQLSPEDAVALFELRAKAAGYETASDRTVIAGIVQSLDFNPLAIELAAARIGVLTPKQLSERLADRFEVLRDDRRDVSVRHVTLRAAMDWSWEVLTAADRMALAQCSVFRGGFDLGAAEAVVELESAPPLLDLLQSLRNKSWVQGNTSEWGVLFRLYENVIEYVDEQLQGSARTRAEEAHRRHYLNAPRSKERDPLLAELERDRENLLVIHHRAVLRRSDDAARAALLLQPLFTARGQWETQLAVIEAALEVTEDSALTQALHRLRVATLTEGERQIQKSSVEAPTIKTAEAEASDALLIGPNCDWFQVPGESAVSLERRRVLRRVLAELAKRRIAAPGEPLTLEDVLEAGWPGERVLPKAAASRVYVAIGTLRRLGLRDALITKGDGYLLHPSVELKMLE